MAVLTTFLWSNKDSVSLWHFKLSFAICKIAEAAKLIDFLMSDDLLSNLLWYGRIFRFWATAILLTNWDFRDSSSQYCFATSPKWPDMARPVFIETRLLLFISLKMSRVSSSTTWFLTFELASLTCEEIL